MTDAIEWHRLHPAMLLFQLAGILRRYFFLFVVGGVASSRGENFVNFILLSSAFALSVGLLRYLSYRYSLDDQYLTVTEGIFTKKSQRYLLDKINHVNRHQNPLAKVMGIVRLEVQQEASNLPALMLPAVTFQQAETIEAAIQHHSTHVVIGNSVGESGTKHVSVSGDDNRQVLYQSTLAKSLLEGLTSLPVRLLFVIGILYRFYGGALTPYIIDEYRFYETALRGFGIDREQQFWAFLIVTLVCVYLIGLLVSLVAALVRWFRYEVVAKSHYIFIASGLFTRSTRVINPRQIQTIVGIANPLRRWFDLCQWQIVAPRPGGQRGRASQLVPIGNTADIYSLLPTIWANCHYPDDENWLAVDRYHRRRLWLFTLFTLSVVIGIIIIVDTAFNRLATEALWLRLLHVSLLKQFVFIAVIGLALLLSRRLVQFNYAATGYRVDERFLFIKSAFLSQRSYVIPIEKIQATIFNRSLFQRRRGLATVELDVNGILRPIRLYNISIDIAERLREQIIDTVNAENA